MSDQGAVALVTGVSSQLGRAVAHQLDDCGFKVVGTSRKPVETNRYVHVCADLLLEDEVDELMSFASDAGQLKVVVHLAATRKDALLVKMRTTDWISNVDENMRMAFFVTRSAIRPMLREGGGSIVLIGSLAGSVGWRGQAAYSSAKSSLIGLARSISREYGPMGLAANVVSPGLIRDTEAAKTMRPRQMRDVERRELLSIKPSCGAVARAVAFLASASELGIAGEVIHVDAGASV